MKINVDACELHPNKILTYWYPATYSYNDLRDYIIPIFPRNEIHPCADYTHSY